MKKSLQIIIAIVIVVVVIGGTFFLSGLKDKDIMKEISYSEYQDAIKDKKTTFVYAGEKGDDYDILKELSKTKNLKINYLNTKNLSKDEKTSVYEKDSANTLFIYEDGKLKVAYDDEFDSYKLTQTLMENNYIDKDYLTVNIDEYLKLIKEDGNHFMFIGSETCSYCSMFKESIKQALKDNNFNVYYLDVSALTEEETEKLYTTDDYFTSEEWGTPLNFLYKDGKRVDILNGYVEADELIKFLEKNKVI